MRHRIPGVTALVVSLALLPIVAETARAQDAAADEAQVAVRDLRPPTTQEVLIALRDVSLRLEGLQVRSTLEDEGTGSDGRR